MSNLILAQYTKAELALKNRIDQLAKGERGADALEWVGMFLVAAALITIIITAVNTMTGDPFTQVIQDALDSLT